MLGVFFCVYECYQCWLLFLGDCKRLKRQHCKCWVGSVNPFLGGGKVHTYPPLFMSKALRLIGFSKQNHICRVLRLLSNMVLQAHTSTLTATPVIFI